MARIEGAVRTGVLRLKKQQFTVEEGNSQQVEAGGHSISIGWEDQGSLPWIEADIQKGERVSVISYLRCFDGQIRPSGYESSLTNVTAHGIVPGSGGHLEFNSTSYRLKAAVVD